MTRRESIMRSSANPASPANIPDQIPSPRLSRVSIVSSDPNISPILTPSTSGSVRSQDNMPSTPSSFLANDDSMSSGDAPFRTPSRSSSEPSQKPSQSGVPLLTTPAPSDAPFDDFGYNDLAIADIRLISTPSSRLLGCLSTAECSQSAPSSGDIVPSPPLPLFTPDLYGDFTDTADYKQAVASIGDGRSNLQRNYPLGPIEPSEDDCWSSTTSDSEPQQPSNHSEPLKVEPEPSKGLFKTVKRGMVVFACNVDREETREMSPRFHQCWYGASCPRLDVETPIEAGLIEVPEQAHVAPDTVEHWVYRCSY